MGKRYHCDYCDKAMVSTPTIVKTHNKGIAHQKIVQEHYQKYKDAETILAEESAKRPCIRYAKGECPFGSICRYTHYTWEHLNALKEHVALKNLSKSLPRPSFEDLYKRLQTEKSMKQETSDGNTVLYDDSGVTHIFPWIYNPVFDSYENLPQSIKRFKIEDFTGAKVSGWG